MTQHHTGLHCNHCGRFTMHAQDQPNIQHVVYALFTLFSCGLWGLVWFLVSITAKPGPWLCSQCGCMWTPHVMGGGRPIPGQSPFGQQPANPLTPIIAQVPPAVIPYDALQKAAEELSQQAKPPPPPTNERFPPIVRKPRV